MGKLRVDLDELERARQATGITTDTDLARRLHVDKGTVSRVLSGKSEPGPKFITAALERLPTNFDSLFFIEGDEVEQAVA